MGFREYAAEFTATFLLLLVGLSAVSVNFGDGSPIPSWIPNEAVRRLLTGILFAGGATAIVYSPLGQRSGGHLNPAVTLAFLRLGKMTRRSAVFYIVAQILGALAGAIRRSRSVGKPCSECEPWRDRSRRGRPGGCLLSRGRHHIRPGNPDPPVRGPADAHEVHGRSGGNAGGPPGVRGGSRVRDQPQPSSKPGAGHRKRCVLMGVDLLDRPTDWSAPCGVVATTLAGDREVREAVPYGSMCLPLRRLQIHLAWSAWS